MDHDPLAVIAESYKTIADTQQILAQTQFRMEETARDMTQTQRLGFRLQGFSLVLLGLSLLFTGVVVWQHLAMRHENAALNQAVLTNTQTIAAQTQALLERLGQR
jgi:hypothetical protein